MAFQGGGAPRFAIGRVISESLTIVSHHMFRFLGIILAVAIPAAVLVTLAAMLLASGVQTAGMNGNVSFANNGNAAVFFILLSAVSIVSYFLIQAALTYGALQTLRGRAAGIGACLGQAFSALPRLFLAGLVLFVLGALVAGVAALAVGMLRGGAAPGVATGGSGAAVVLSSLIILGLALYIVVLVWVFVPALMVERVGPIACFFRSMALTKGRRWSILGLVLILFVANLIVSALTRALIVNGAPLGGAVLNVLAALFFMALSAVLAAVGYYYLRAEKEGVAIDDVVKVFD